MSRSQASLPQRVFMTADAVGGVWTYAMELARGLVHRGVEVELAVVGPHPGAEELAVAEQIDGLFVISTGLPLDWTAEGEAAALETARHIRDLAVRSGATVAHIHAPGLIATETWNMPLVVSAHSCVRTWWSAVRGGPLPPDLKWRARLTHSGLVAADAVIAPSRAFARCLEATYKLTQRVNAIHNGAPPAPRSYQAGRSGAIFTAGRLWDAGKDIGVLDAAAGRIRHPVLAAGPPVGPNGARFDARHIELLGVLGGQAMEQQYAAAGVFVAPALYEPFGLAVLEAAQRATALVLSDIPTFRELWDEAALFVRPGDVNGLAAVLQQVSDDSSLRRKLGGRARVRALRYSAQRFVECTLQVYQRILADNEGRGVARNASASMQ